MKKVCGLDMHKDSIFACILDEQEKNQIRPFSLLSPLLMMEIL
jgi:exoribonuclease II